MADHTYIPVDHDPYTDPGVPNYLGHGVVWMGSQPPTMYKDAYKEIGQKAYEMTGIPDIQAGTQQLSEGNILPGIGQTAAGALQFGSLIAPPYVKAAKEIGIGAAQPIRNILADEAGTFLGRQAVGADLDTLKVAEQSAAKYPRENIRQATGWIRGPDNQWRYELSDVNSSVNPDVWEKLRATPPITDTTLPSLLSHPELYKAYPGLFEKYKVEGVPFFAGTDYQAAVNPELKRIGLNPDMTSPELRSSLLHEIQHVIQNKEGFAEGGSPTHFLPPNYDDLSNNAVAAHEIFTEKLQQKYPPAIVNAVMTVLEHPGADRARLQKMLGKDLTDEAFDMRDMFRDLKNMHTEAETKYGNLAGETEARLVQARRNLSPDELKRYSPFPGETKSYSADTPESDQIVQFGPTGIVPYKQQPFRLIPVDHIPEFK